MGVCFKAHPAPAILADRTFVDDLDPGGIKRGKQSHQRVHVTADHMTASFHALDCRNRNTCQLGQLALIDTEKSPGGP